MIVADTHVHLYRCYDTARALRCAHVSLRAHEARAHAVICLTERADDHAFAGLRDGTLHAPGWTFETTPETAVLRAFDESGAVLWILAGRQIVTAERIEVLALGADFRPPDGASMHETLAMVRGVGAFTVLPWSPGKWLGGRGRVVARLIDEAEPGSLALGDTVIRPTFMRDPKLFVTARAKGIGVLPGTDPLPFPGEERRIGAYAARWSEPFDGGVPATSLRALFAGPAPETLGVRNGFFTAARRWLANRRAK